MAILSAPGPGGSTESSLAFYTPGEEGLQPGKVMQQIKEQNILPGSFVVYSHQAVTNTTKKDNGAVSNSMLA